MTDPRTEPETSAPSDTGETHETHEATEVAPTRDRPDLDVVQAKIDEAHQSEDHLVQVMPGSIDSDADDSRVQTEGGTKETDDRDETEGAERS